jgi:hypothetical protein
VKELHKNQKNVIVIVQNEICDIEYYQDLENVFKLKKNNTMKKLQTKNKCNLISDAAWVNERAYMPDTS